MPRVIVFDETGETRIVKGPCMVCYPNTAEYREDFVVSPQGISHYDREWGLTRCGKDATGPNWWWKQ